MFICYICYKCLYNTKEHCSKKELSKQYIFTMENNDFYKLLKLFIIHVKICILFLSGTKYQYLYRGYSHQTIIYFIHVYIYI